MERYTNNYVIAALIISVFLSASFYFADIIDGMFYSAFWGTVIGFAVTFSVWCDKYVDGSGNKWK